MIDAVHQIERGSTTPDHLAIQVLAAQHAAVALRNRRQEFEQPPVVLHFGSQAGELGRVGGIENGRAVIESLVGAAAHDLPLRQLGGGVARGVGQEVGPHIDGGLIDPGAHNVERGGAAQVQVALLSVAGSHLAQDHEGVDARNGHKKEQSSEARQQEPAPARLSRHRGGLALRAARNGRGFHAAGGVVQVYRLAG